MEPLQAVKGMNDLLPEEMPRWARLEQRFREHTALHGYREIRTPLLEPTQLFVRSIGEATDIVEKEMYTFTDKGEHSLTLRPEGTASAVRAYLEHKVYALEPVTKWIYIGPMFRRERPAKGRYRQFHQLGAELYGDEGPFCDAEMIDMLVSFLRASGVEDLEVLVNSLGSGETRERYKDALVTYLTPHAEKLGEDSRRRLGTNPLRVLDSKDPRDAEVVAGAPSILEHLGEADRAHFEGLKDALTALGTPFRVEPRLVRGLDYYSRTLFEVRGRGGELGAQNAICGGGRYDGLVESLGGQATPSIGFAIGLERLLLATTDATRSASLDAFVICASPALRGEGLKLARDLRGEGLAVECDLRGQSMKSQLRRADKSGARVALVLGDSELARGVVQLKELAQKAQRDVPRAEVAQAIRDARNSGPA